jgi:hypothetical protein
MLIILLAFSEEMAEDVRSRMRAIQDEEISQLRDLTTFLDLELHFATQYVDVLKNVKAEWCAEYVVLCTPLR